MIQNLRVPIEAPLLALKTNVPFENRPGWCGIGSYPLYMDLLLPKARDGAPRPAIVFFCGGSFMEMDRSIWLPALMPLAKRGYVVASADYRVGWRGAFPAPIEDAKSAVRCLRAHASEWNIDPNRIALMGESAGGFTAVLGALAPQKYDVGEHLEQSSRVQAVVDIYGKVDMFVPCPDSGLESLVTRVFCAGNPTETLRQEATARSYVDENTPPFFILHGDQDPLIDLEESRRLHHALTQNGVRCDFYILEGEGHGTDAFYQPEILHRIADFLDEVL